MEKIRALHEFKETVGSKELLRVEEVFILQFLNDGKNALVAKRGEFYNPTGEALSEVPRAVGLSTALTVMSVDSLVIVDENVLPRGVVWTEREFIHGAF